MISTQAPWDASLEPNEGNVRQWLNNLYSKGQPLAQSRWNEGNIDTLFYGGAQTFVNRYFGFNGASTNNNWYFNIIQQPCNMITGYERQHRKNFSYVPADGGDAQTTDQYTRLITQVANMGDIHEQKSKAKELACISGMCLLQPYLDYTAKDPAQGTLKVHIWEFSAFMTDPYWRSPDMSDANWIWLQQYISKQEALARFGDKVQQISPMSSSPQRYGNFYFLPENFNMNRNDLMVISYVWYKWKIKKKRLYSESRNQFFDYAGGDENLEALLYNIPDLEPVEVDIQGWKLATVLNDQLMFQGENPLGFEECPVVPYYWNYEPHQTYPDLVVRGLIRTARSSQYLFNHKVISNNDIASATINAGWKRKVGAVANEDNLKKAGQGWDVIINPGYEMTDVEKIIPSAVPDSDLALAEQMKELMFATTGINMENWSGQDDKQTSSLTVLLKQAANLMVFQKYFDQWDYSDKLLGNLLLKIALNKWNAEKVKLYIQEEPTPYFYSKVFSNFQCIVEESDLTPTQQNLQAQQMMDINAQFGREVFPPSKIIPKLNITGKGEIIPFLEQQEQMAQQQQQDMQNVQHMVEDAKLKELYSKATANIARAREDHSRSESNLGLYEERLSMIERNRALSLKEKQAALTSLLENISRFGEIETTLKQNELESINYEQMFQEEREKQDVERRTGANKFLAEIMGQMGQPGQNGQNPTQNMSGNGQNPRQNQQLG